MSPKSSTSAKQERVRSSTQKRCGKEKPKRCESFDEFEVKMKVVKTEARITPGKKVWSKWVETRKDPNKPWCESSGLSPREGSTQSKSRTEVYQEMWMFELLLWTSSTSEIPSACSFGECKVRGFEGWVEQKYHFVLRDNAEGPPQETKDLEFAQESVRYSRHESSVCNTRGGRS